MSMVCPNIQVRGRWLAGRRAFHFLLGVLAATALASLTGVAVAAQLAIAQVAPLSGLEAAQGRAYAAGLQLQFEILNRAGGVNGHTFTLIRRDDAGRPEDTVGLTTQIMATNRPIALAGYFGSKNIADLIATGLLQREKMALVGYRVSDTGPDFPNLFNVRANLREEIKKITEHAATIGMDRLGLFYEAGPETSALIAYVEKVAQAAKVHIDVRASYVPGSTNVNSAVSSFIARPPQAIIMLSSGSASAAFIERYRSAGGTAQLFAHSGADIEQLSKRLSQEQMQGVAIAQVTPNPYKISTRVTREFNEAVSKVAPMDVPISFAMIEGFIAARVIAEAVRRQGSNPTRAGTLEALANMTEFDAGGLLISFKPESRSGSKAVELSIVTSSGRIRQ
jgi:branched-chain amino acid transport system substrate-binding protein